MSFTRGNLNGAIFHWQIGRGMSTFDPMAAAIDWLDAYRAGSLSIVDLYASGAAFECGCGDMKVARGRLAISDYWLKRFADYPAGELLDLQPNGDAIVVSYRVPAGPVLATLYFNCDGKIARSACGPTSEGSPNTMLVPARQLRPHSPSRRQLWDGARVAEFKASEPRWDIRSHL